MQSLRGHIYFKCPISEEPVLDLYLGGRTLGSRTALKLRYPCQQIGVEEWWVMKLMDWTPSDVEHAPMPKHRYTRPTPPQKLLDPERTAQALEERAERRRDQERRWRQEAVDALWAQHAAGGDPGSPPPRPGEAVAMSRFLKAASKVIDYPGEYELLANAEPLVLESLPWLDLRRVARDGHVRPKERTCLQLRWTRQWRELQYVYLAIDLSDMDAPLAEILFGRWGEVARRQRLALLPQRGTAARPRFSFDVPGHGPAEVLAYRAERFAPRQLQRLVNQSQRRTRADFLIEPAALARADAP